MKFEAIKQNQTRSYFKQHSAFESSNSPNTIDVEGENMKVAILTDEIIEGNQLPEITSPVWFKNNSEPSDDSLFSKIIFGDTPKSRMKNHAYIDLKRKFFHPYIYEVIVKLNRKIETIAMGQGAWYIDELGHLEQILDEDDKRYNEDNTGLGWLIENFRRIKFKETGSDKTHEKIDLVCNQLSDSEIFITKWIVIPIFYRDYDHNSGNKSIPEINYQYNTILSSVSSYENELLSISQHMTLYRVQKTLVEIRKSGQALLEKKNGAFQKTVLGKANDFGDRGVISVPSLNGCDVPNDCIVDVLHSGIPLAKCIRAGEPFILKWIAEFLEDTFRNKTKIPALVNDGNGKKHIEYVDIEDQTEIYTYKYIEKKLEMYYKSYGKERFETVKIKCKDGSMKDFIFPGQGYLSGDVEETLSNARPMTWTDLVYLAAVETLSDKHCYITRYPVEDYFGVFPSKVAVLSTVRTTPVIFNGKVYPHYPVIDLSASEEEVATQFIDAITISNLYLEAIGGD